METAAQVRNLVVRTYIDPARRQKRPTVTVVAGDVHKAAGLVNRVPIVCQALTGRKFLEENHLVIEKKEGPKSGLGTTVKITYRLMDEKASKPEPVSFMDLVGVAKDLFARLGGGEAFIRKEREPFYGDKRDLD
jgi:hypothetical protein